MKKFVLAGVALAVGIAVAFIFVRPQGAQLLHVSEVGSDPAAFVGTISVTGITAGFSRHDPTIFGLMDVKELQCTTPNCNKLLLPVKHTGKPPAIGDEIRISGAFVQAGGGYLFAAESIEVVRNHKLGG